MSLYILIPFIIIVSIAAHYFFEWIGRKGSARLEAEYPSLSNYLSQNPHIKKSNLSCNDCSSTRLRNHGHMGKYDRTRLINCYVCGSKLYHINE